MTLTNNDVEGFNRIVNKVMRAKNPNIYKCIDGIKRLQGLVKFILNFCFGLKLRKWDTFNGVKINWVKFSLKHIEKFPLSSNYQKRCFKYAQVLISYFFIFISRDTCFWRKKHCS